MARLQSVGIFCLVFVVHVISSSGSSIGVMDEERQVYIAYMGSLPESEEYSPSNHHLNILREAVDIRFVEQSLIRSYKRSFNGFAASLTIQEKQNIAERDDVLLIFPSKTLKLHTTGSWDFMNFHQDVHRDLPFESDIIIGLVDSGIWPESESFDDHGFGPVPKKWKGDCRGGKNFTCNNKLIGARNYVSEEDSARDIEGHGTHTASTAAGNNVQNASFYGIAEGTARGAVPSARIAAYKACSRNGCTEDGILAAFDDAIADGVDILSVSLGSDSPAELQYNTIAIGSFHAVKKGILTVQSAGNAGDSPGTVCSTAPWLFSVAASTITRNFVSKIGLGNGRTLAGNTINAFKLNGTQFPLVNAKNATKACEDTVAEQCYDGCLDRDLVKGKIVLCNTTDSLAAMDEVYKSGGLGAISVDDESSPASVSPFPFSSLSLQLFKQVDAYLKSTELPKANFLGCEATKDDSAPTIAVFSSRGPNGNHPDILKPDITAPGVNILAAYSPAASPSSFPDIDHRSLAYDIISGTSMSCPHVAGAAAYVKSLHPSWSPSAIKSALMTTAWKMDATNPENKDAEFGYGAGHLNPIKAAHPGLVYNTKTSELVRFICGLNISQAATKIFGDNRTCNRATHIEAKDLNYPTMAAKVQTGKRFRVTFPRTVENVGVQNSTYKATISNTSHLSISVKPNTLYFKETHEKKSFVVTVAGERVQEPVSASLEWSDGIHSVRSPIVVYA